MRRRAKQPTGFSLIELVMVVVIIAVIGAIAIPRLSRGSAAAEDSALTADLEMFHKAIDLYAAEHDGRYPDVASIALQLTMFTDSAGGTSSSRDTTHLFGPYLRAIPAQPKGVRKGQTGIATADAATIGWIYDATNGVMTANTGGTTGITGLGNLGGGAVDLGGGAQVLP